MVLVVAGTVGLSLLVGLPPAWKWQLGVRRCAGWLAGLAFVVGLLTAMLGGAIRLATVLQVVAAVLLTLAISTALLAYRFYRDPEREPPSIAGAVLSPADGEVVYVRRSEAGVVPSSTKQGRTYQLDELTGTPLRFRDAVVVGIAMNFLDVHINRAPIAGRVSLRKHIPGSFLSLRLPSAEVRNERATTVIESQGLQIAVVQIASRLVRQIVG